MAKSKLAQANEKIAEKVVSGYKGIEETVVGGYKKVEETVVDGYKKVEDKFVDRYLTQRRRNGRESQRASERRARITLQIQASKRTAIFCSPFLRLDSQTKHA